MPLSNVLGFNAILYVLFTSTKSECSRLIYIKQLIGRIMPTSTELTIVALLSFFFTSQILCCVHCCELGVKWTVFK
jgi:hypothetical protein